MMTRFAWPLLVSLLLALPGASGCWHARLTRISKEGLEPFPAELEQVYVFRQGERIRAHVGLELEVGDVIETGPGLEVHIEYSEGGRLVLEPLTQVQVLNPSLWFWWGVVLSHTLRAKTRYLVVVPDGTIYMAEVDGRPEVPPDEPRVGVTVVDGAVSVAPQSIPDGDGQPRAKRRVAKGETLLVPAGNWPQPKENSEKTKKAEELLERSRIPVGFVRIEPGTFTMGSPGRENGREDNEGPQHAVTITRAFYLQATEVTQARWKALMNNNPSTFQSCGDYCPVHNVSWWDAVAYANELSEAEGLPACYQLRGCKGTPGEGDYTCAEVDPEPLPCRGYRLPTEAEWEYAARAGTKKSRYGALDAIAWYRKNAGGEPHQVRGKEKNAWGLYDMLGNVSEWVWDWYRASSYRRDPPPDPTGPDSGSKTDPKRVFRGGRWNSKRDHVRAANRGRIEPDRGDELGFRLARDVP